MHAIALLTPLPSHQRVVMEAVYGKEGLKIGRIEEPRRALHSVSETLIEIGAELVLAGCVELSLAFEDELTGAHEFSAAELRIVHFAPSRF